MNGSDLAWQCSKCQPMTFSDSYFDSSTNSSFEDDQGDSTINGNVDKPTSRVQQCNKGTNTGKLKCMLVNCRSVVGKSADLIAHIEEAQPDIVYGTESWLHEDIQSTEIFPSNFTVFRKDRNTTTKGGGVFQAIRKNLIATSRPDLDSDAETLWTEVQLRNNCSFISGVFYRTSEDKHGHRIQELEKSILGIGNDINKKNVLLVGDFNLPNINWEENVVQYKSGYSTEAAEKLIDLAGTHGLEQIVTEPTRSTETTDNILDLAFVNNVTNVRGVEVVDGISDHDIVEINLNFTPKTKRRKRRKVFLRDKANKEAIFKDLDDFSDVYKRDFVNKSTDEKWSAISDAINKTIEANVPQKLTSARHDVPWFTNELRRLMKTKRRRYNRYRATRDARDWEKFRKTRNEVSSKLRCAKARYYGEELGEAIENNPKAFWTHLKNLRKEDVGVADLKDGAGKLVTDSKIKAEMLNKQFVSVFTNESGQPPSMESEPVADCPPLIITEEGVEKLLRELDPSKASGADNIPAWFLKMASKQLAPIFTNLFQSSINSGVVPEDWRRANITALFKKGDRSDPGNYRPVSLTSVTCKVLEHIVHSHVMKYLESHSILVDTQHGFRAKRSTESQLILTINDIAKSFDAKKNVDMAVLDFTKAFDKVPHRRLIHKLSHYGIRNSLNT